MLSIFINVYNKTDEHNDFLYLCVFMHIHVYYIHILMCGCKS